MKKTLQEYNMRKQIDIQLGEAMEKKYKDVIFNYFNIVESDVKTKHSKYSVIDWVVKNKKTKEQQQIELKSRTNTKNQYQDTMYGLNKLLKQIEGLQNNTIQKAYAVFAFSDEIAYYEITKDSLKEGLIRIAAGGRNDRGTYETSTYAYIDISLLTTIKKFEVNGCLV